MELYERPQNAFVAQFIGSPKMNVTDCSSENGLLKLGDVATTVPAPDNSTHFGIRPEDLSIASVNDGTVSGKVDIIHCTNI